MTEILTETITAVDPQSFKQAAEDNKETIKEAVRNVGERQMMFKGRFTTFIQIEPELANDISPVNHQKMRDGIESSIVVKVPVIKSGWRRHLFNWLFHPGFKVICNKGNATVRDVTMYPGDEIKFTHIFFMI